MKISEHERRDWAIIAIIILIGFGCVFLAGSWAVRFAPSWNVNADLGSKLDPNSDFLTKRPGGLIPAIDAAILTPPIWAEFFLTPGAVIPTRVRPADTVPPPTLISTRVNPTNTNRPTYTPTGTAVYFPPAYTFTSHPVITRTFIPAGTFTATLTPTSVPPPTQSIPPQADLQITISDGATHYAAGVSIQYTIMVSNPVGPVGVTSAMVTGSFSSDQLIDISWTCTASAGASCAASGTGNISDGINLPVGSSVTYKVLGTVISSPVGSLAGTASVAAPSGITDHDPSNNSSTDVDEIIVSSSFPSGEIGINHDGKVTVIPPGSSVTLTFDSPLIVGAHGGYDLVLYELANGTGIAMDLVKLEISDGYNWYTIFNWGDNMPDTNSNMNIGNFGGIENDNRDFTTIPASDVLYPFGTGTDTDPATGVVMELDSFVPNGVYYYIRITSPSGGLDAGCEVDGIEILP